MNEAVNIADSLNDVELVAASLYRRSRVHLIQNDYDEARDVVIDGYLVPKGYVVLLAPYTLHRRADYFPQPESFMPERFTPEREKLLPRYAYLPFGAGPRVCIGLHFAMMEGHLLLATLAQRTTFSLLPHQAIKPDPIHHLTLRPVGTVHISVKKR